MLIVKLEKIENLWRKERKLHYLAKNGANKRKNTLFIYEFRISIDDCFFSAFICGLVIDYLRLTIDYWLFDISVVAIEFRIIFKDGLTDNAISHII